MDASHPEPDRKKGLSIRARLLVLVFAAILPMLLFCTLLLERAYHGRTALIESNAAGMARQLSQAVDARVMRAQAVILAVAESSLMDAADLAPFEITASRALVAGGLEGVAMLARADGTKVAHTLAVPGQALPPLQDMAGLQRLFATGKPQASGLYLGNITHEQQVALHVPIWRGDQVIYDGVVALSARSLAAVLDSQALPRGWSAILFDRQGEAIGGSQESGIVAGQKVAPALTAPAAAAPDGEALIRDAQGARVFTAFSQSTVTGWTVALMVPAAVLTGPRLDYIGVLGAGGLALLLATGVLAWLTGRSIARPVRALAEQAARLGRHELPDPAATQGVAEAEAAGDALFQAAQMLRARDSEREAALQRAEESEARLLLAQEAGEIGAWETEAATGRRTWSPQQFTLYGVNPASGPPHGESWAALIHPDDRDRVLAMVARAYQQPLSWQNEFRVLTGGGDVRWLRSAGSSLFRDGKPYRLLGITLETTDRHRAEATLRDGAARLEAEVATRTRELADSEARFRTYFEHSAEALFVLRATPDGFVYETLNRAAETLTGLRTQDAVGHRPSELLLPETADVIEAGLRAVAATAAPLSRHDLLALPAGSLELDTMLVPLADPATGAVTRIVGSHRDLTEQRRLELRLGHAQRLEAVGQLTGGVAHDFNNLLTVVIGNLSLLRRRVQGDERAERYLSSVEQAAQRGAKLTSSLLAFSRRSTLQVVPQDVGALLQESTTLLHRALGEEVDLALDVAPNLPMARADSAQLEAAVLNLVINARDAMQDDLGGERQRGGTVRVQVRAAVLRAEELQGNDEANPGRFVAIVVRDTGAGMTPEVRARAFEPFFTTKEIGQGTGLGLSQVFGFVRQLGGHVTLDSTPGHGTRVAMYLPVGEMTATPAEPVASPGDVPPQGAVILLVEDDDSIREVTSEVLRDAGFSVLSAASGPEALRILQGADVVDALFSDVVMPGGTTGVDLARKARELRPGLPVLLTSGYAGTALTRYDADGEFEVLAKPYSRSMLIARFCAMLPDVVPAK